MRPEIRPGGRPEKRPEMTTAGVLVEYEGKILILLRSEGKTDAGKWGIPAGKVVDGESLIETAARELYEETQIAADENQLKYCGNYDGDFSDIYIHFPTYRIQTTVKPNVTINPIEHKEYRWATPEECHSLENLIRGLPKLLEKVYLGK